MKKRGEVCWLVFESMRNVASVSYFLIALNDVPCRLDLQQPCNERIPFSLVQCRYYFQRLPSRAVEIFFSNQPGISTFNPSSLLFLPFDYFFLPFVNATRIREIFHTLRIRGYRIFLSDQLNLQLRNTDGIVHFGIINGEGRRKEKKKKICQQIIHQ